MCNTYKMSQQGKQQQSKQLRKEIIKLGLIDHFNEDVINEADDLFKLVRQYATEQLRGQLRGEKRRAVIFACIYYSGKMTSEYKTPYNLMNIFSLTISACRKGIKIVERAIDKDISTITTGDVIYDILVRNFIQSDKVDEVMKLYTKIYKKSSLLNNTLPKTLAAALVKVWSIRKGLSINLNNYVHEDTIKKVVEEIERVLK